MATTWNNAEQKPTEPGIYKRKYGRQHVYCKWDGQDWYCREYSVEHARNAFVKTDVLAPWTDAVVERIAA